MSNPRDSFKISFVKNIQVVLNSIHSNTQNNPGKRGIKRILMSGLASCLAAPFPSPRWSSLVTSSSLQCAPWEPPGFFGVGLGLCSVATTGPRAEREADHMPVSHGGHWGPSPFLVCYWFSTFHVQRQRPCPPQEGSSLNPPRLRPCDLFFQPSGLGLRRESITSSSLKQRLPSRNASAQWVSPLPDLPETFLAAETDGSAGMCASAWGNEGTQINPAQLWYLQRS